MALLSLLIMADYPSPVCRQGDLVPIGGNAELDGAKEESWFGLVTGKVLSKLDV